MKKKLAVILMSSILAVSSLVGCGSSSASESGTENANTVQRKQTLPLMQKQLLYGLGTTTLMLQ